MRKSRTKKPNTVQRDYCARFLCCGTFFVFLFFFEGRLKTKWKNTPLTNTLLRRSAIIFFHRSTRRPIRKTDVGGGGLSVYILYYIILCTCYYTIIIYASVYIYSEFCRVSRFLLKSLMRVCPPPPPSSRPPACLYNIIIM